MIQFKKNVAHLDEICSVESAEELFAWLIEKPTRKVDASACQEMHTAVLQVLLLCRPKIVAYPTQPWLVQATANLLKG